MLNSPEEDVLAKACEAIYKFALKGLGVFQFLSISLSFIKYLLHKGYTSPCSLIYFLTDEFFQTTRMSFKALPEVTCVYLSA
jgi:hypothetical protein